MLYEAPPYYLVNGVSVLRDHADPTQFYYQPLAPRFVTRTDGAIEVPQLSLLEFRGADLNGGLLDFDVHLGLTPDELEEVRQQVGRLAGLPRLPTLSPVPVIDGSVTLMLFGTGTGADPTALVRTIRHAARPSLYGDNRAAFSVLLEQPGVTLLKKAMAKELAPIGVCYSLDHLALRPAYHVKLSISWDRVQEVLDTEYGQEGLFTSISIGDTVEKLVEERAIVLDTDTFVPEDDDSGIVARRDAALARVRDMITDAFFTSSIDPQREEPDGWDKAVEVVKSFAPQRFAPLGVFSYRRQHYSRVDRKRLDVDFSERTTVRRTIYPQGHLSGLFRAVGDGLDPARLITPVDIDDPFFRRRKVTLISRADFDRDPVQSMTAVLTYNGTTETVRLDEQQPTGSREWLSEVVDGRMVVPVSLRYTVELTPDGTGERPLRLESEAEEVLAQEKEIQPRALFAEEDLPILTAPRFPFDRYPRVDVQLRYDDPDHGVHQDDVVRLTAESRDVVWKRFLVGPPAAPVLAKITYRGADGRVREGAFAPLGAAQVDVPDPFPQRLVVRIVEALSAEVERAFVDLTFLDPDRGQEVSTSIEVLPDQPVEPFVVDREDPRATLVQYRITVLMKDGRLLELPRSSTRTPRIFVRDDLGGHRTVLLRSPDLDPAKVSRIEVEVRAGEPGLRTEDRFTLSAPGDTALFEFDFLDPALDAFEVRTRHVFRNGLSTQRDWARFDTDTLTMPPA